MTGAGPLAARVLDAFPSGQYGLLGLLRVLDIVETNEVATAAIECTALPLIHVNPAFVATFAETPEKLFMLVMHELHHLLLGHTRLFPRPTPAHNVVFDAIINAMLCRMFPRPEFTSLFTGFYNARRFPECILRPPPRWTPDGNAVAATGLTPGLRDLYRALYSETGAGYEELFKALASEVAAAPTPMLLGDHGAEPPQLDSSGVLFDAVRAIVERWPQPPRPIQGRSWADALRSEQVKTQASSSDAVLLASLIRSIARSGALRNRARRVG